MNHQRVLAVLVLTLAGCGQSHGPPPLADAAAADASDAASVDGAQDADTSDAGGPDAPPDVCEGVDCSDLDGACQLGRCDPATGACEMVPLSDDTSCDDGDSCTEADACVGGACVGTNVDCSGMTDACRTGSCDPTTGSCVAIDTADGTTCDDLDACTTSDVCVTGTCAGASLDCSAMTDACHVGSCDSATGSCAAVVVPDDSPCDDADPCTESDSCTTGACAGVSVDCSAMTDGCNVGTCGASGACEATPVTDGISCDDLDACTETDSCTGGVCAGALLDCSALDSVCHVGTCDSTTGACVSLAQPDGTTCADTNLCTGPDTCTGGSCSGAPLAVCGALVPGRTDLTTGADGWTVRCLTWRGTTCARMQAMIDCTTCGTYPRCDVWHDLTDYNNGEMRTSLNWCALATGDSTVTSESVGTEPSAAPRGCGWNSINHPLCLALGASYQSSVPGITPTGGVLLDEEYCLNSTVLLAVECAGW